MAQEPFTLLWQKILNSSLWVNESKETRLVWIAILAMKDAEGRVMSSVVGLADRAKVSVDECRSAVKALEGVDPDDTSGVNDGRRIVPIQGGWMVVNHDLYRFSTEAKREFWRQQKAEQRRKLAEKEKRLRMPRKGPTKRERDYEQNGEPEPTPNPENEPF